MPTKSSRRPRMGNKVYQLKVTLRRAKPPIWRRLLVTDDTYLDRLHLIIQDAMGWQNCHLYQFDTGSFRYMEYFEEDFIDDNQKPASSIRLGDLGLQKGRALRYMYDFGDGWLHEIKVEGIARIERGAQYPRCIAGRRACPPEDCGGIFGYHDMLCVLGSKSDPEGQEYLEGLRRDWDPDEFDLQKTDALLRALYGR